MLLSRHDVYSGTVLKVAEYICDQQPNKGDNILASVYTDSIDIMIYRTQKNNHCNLLCITCKTLGRCLICIYSYLLRKLDIVSS